MSARNFLFALAIVAKSTGQYCGPTEQWAIFDPKVRSRNDAKDYINWSDG